MRCLDQRPSRTCCDYYRDNLYKISRTSLAIPVRSRWQRTTPGSDHAAVTHRCAIALNVSAVITSHQ